MNFPFRGVSLGGSDQKRSYDIKVSLAKVRNLAKKTEVNIFKNRCISKKSIFRWVTPDLPP